MGSPARKLAEMERERVRVISNPAAISTRLPELTSSDFDRMIQKCHRAVKEFYKGNPEPFIQLCSRRKDVSLAGGFGGISVGPEKVAKNLGMRSSYFKAGQEVTWETVAKSSVRDLGYIVEVERFEARVGGTDERVTVALRVTTVFRLEDGNWKVIHRHGDPMSTRIDPSTYLSLAKYRGEIFE